MQIEELQDKANLAYDRELAKRNIKNQMQSRLTVAFNGGVFSVTKEQITFLNLLGSQEIILLDDYEIPIKLNASELLNIMFQRYHEVMNEWHLAYEEQSKVRSARHV